MTNSNISVLNNYFIFEIFMMKKKTKKKTPIAEYIYIYILKRLFILLEKKISLKKLLFEHNIIHVGRGCQGCQRKTKSELLGFIIS
jgi:hypothetical protein